MNNKGQSQIGILISLAIVLIVGVILLQASAQQVGSTVNTINFTNVTFAAPANGGSLNLQGKLVTDFVAINRTNGTGVEPGPIIAAGNFTINNNQVTNGELTANLTVDDAEFAGFDWNITYTTQPATFISESGGRALANIIILLFALALLVVSIMPVVRQKFL